MNCEPVALDLVDHSLVNSKPAIFRHMNSSAVSLDPQVMNSQFSRPLELWNSFSWPPKLWTSFDSVNSKPLELWVSVDPMNSELVSLSSVNSEAISSEPVPFDPMNFETVSLDPMNSKPVKSEPLTQFCFLCLLDNPRGNCTKAPSKTKREPTGRLCCFSYHHRNDLLMADIRSHPKNISSNSLKFYAYHTMPFERNEKDFWLFSSTWLAVIKRKIQFL